MQRHKAPYPELLKPSPLDKGGRIVEGCCQRRSNFGCIVSLRQQESPLHIHEDPLTGMERAKKPFRVLESSPAGDNRDVKTPCPPVVKSPSVGSVSKRMEKKSYLQE